MDDLHNPNFVVVRQKLISYLPQSKINSFYNRLFTRFFGGKKNV